MAARILALKLNIMVPPSVSGKPFTLREVLSGYLGVDERHTGAMEPQVLSAGLEKILAEVEVLRPEGLGFRRDATNLVSQLGLTMEEVIQASDLSSDEFQTVFLSWVDGECTREQNFPVETILIVNYSVEASHFQIYKRARHIFSEALRVLQFRQLCLSSSQPSANDGSATATVDLLKSLGNLINASQESCASFYECSCPELDELTQIARDAGAYGSRLTGAGWGGCTVSLVDESDVEGFIQRVKSRYGPYQNLDDDELKEVIFATRPGSGAFGTPFTFDYKPQ